MARNRDGHMMHCDRSIPGWFQEICRNHLIDLIYRHGVKSVLEVGAFLGKSTVFFADRVETVFSVDFWTIEKLGNEDEKKLAEELYLPADFINIWRDNVDQADIHTPMFGHNSMFGHVLEINPLAPFTSPVDLVYIDGDHSYEAVKTDIRKYAPLARKIVCGDDFGLAPGVTQAVMEIYPSASYAGPFWWIEI